VMSAPIAEFVFAAILAVEKQLPAMWGPDAPVAGAAQLGTLEGATVGLVGLGSIGTAVATRALAFGMNVVAARRGEQPSGLPGVTVAPLLDVVAAADHLVLAAPATAATRNLIDAAVLNAVKPGVHIVTVARGSLIDQDALLASLYAGRVGWASLDVTEPETLPADHPLVRHPRVRISPHVSWSAPQVRPRNVERFIDNLRRYLAGEPLVGVVDAAAGY
jgi:phosphoglycerate dehydrogenase-like enzyme